MTTDFLTKQDAVTALSKMINFHNDLTEVMSKHNFDILDNLGRRNILLSQAQEKYFAESLAKKYKVRSDGRTGEPDIVIESLGKELECKLTSPQKHGAIAFQTDYETLLKKGSLDYLYVVADRSFEKFAVIHYKNLTVDDFRPLSTGARGKTQLMKHKAKGKANILIGNMKSINDTELKKLKKKLEIATTDKKKEKVLKSIGYWNKTPEKFKIELEGINEAVISR